MQKIRKPPQVDISLYLKSLLFGPLSALFAQNTPGQDFFKKNRAKSLFKLDDTLTLCKKSENS